MSELLQAENNVEETTPAQVLDAAPAAVETIAAPKSESAEEEVEPVFVEVTEPIEVIIEPAVTVTEPVKESVEPTEEAIIATSPVITEVVEEITEPTVAVTELVEVLVEPAEEVATAANPIIAEVAEVTGEQEETAAAKRESMTKEEVISILSEVVDGAVDEVKEKVEMLKQTFYKLRRSEVEKQKAEQAEEGLEKPEAQPDPMEEKLKELLSVFKEKKAKVQAELQRIQEENLKSKEALVGEIRKLTEKADDVSRNYSDFQDIQRRWKEITLIPQTAASDLWKQYHFEVERFYELLKINNELREYDFKVNLGLKLALCDAAEKLVEQEDIVSAFHQLQKLHEEWKEIGPVSKADRDEVWNRFKDASTEINKRHQTHFEGIKSREAANEAAKIELCEAAELLIAEEVGSFNEWEAKTKLLLDIQTRWKGVGFASKKVNNALYERFRAACNIFFERKASYYDSVKKTMSENLEKKRALAEEAEQLKFSEEWKITTDRLITMQKEWKKIGAVARKHSDEVWTRFVSACDYFFEQKEQHFGAAKSVEQDNLKAKQAVVEALAAITDEQDADQAAALVKEQMAVWNAIGHVPFKDKDKIYKAYNEQLDRHFGRLKSKIRTNRIQQFTENIVSALDDKMIIREREKLIRAYENMKNELKTYENNIGFFNASSKSGNTLVKEMERKIDKIKNDMQVILEKIDIVDDKIRSEK